MTPFVEHLETRRLMSVTYNPSGTFNGVETPSNHYSAATIIAMAGTKKGGGKEDVVLNVNIAANSVLTGTLQFDNLATYLISGMAVEDNVSVVLDLNGMAVGTFAGKLKSLNKKLTGTFTDTLNGAVIKGRLNLTNAQATAKKSGNTANNLALAPGYYPNETPPPITSGISAGTSAGSEAGITGGNNSGTGIIESGGESLLG